MTPTKTLLVRLASTLERGSPERKILLQAATKGEIPFEVRLAAIHEMIKGISVPGTKREVKKGQWEPSMILSLSKGIMQVDVIIEYGSTWAKPEAKLSPMAPLPGGKLKEVYSLAQKYNSFSDPKKISVAVEQILDLLEKKYAPLDPDLLVKEAHKIQTPSGWSRKEGWGGMGDFLMPYGNREKNQYHVVLVNAEDTIRIISNLNLASPGDYNFDPKNPISGDGHTNFKTDKGWFSFSARGVDDSFYVGEYGNKSFNEAIAEQIPKALKSIEGHKGSVTLNLGPGQFNLPPARLKDLQDSLRTKGTGVLTPGGFGTGYHISTRPYRDRYGVGVAPAEAAKLLGVAKLYWQQFDHD